MKHSLFEFLLIQKGSDFVNGPSTSQQRKLIKETILILTKVIVQEFYLDTSDCLLFRQVIIKYAQVGYNPILVRLVY